MSERTIWFDPDEWPDASGLMLHGDKASLAGAELCLLPARDRDAELVRSLADRGFYFLFEDETPVFPFYALPRLFVFARDEAGFYAADEPIDIESGATIFHVDAGGHVTRAAANLRALTEAMLSDAETKGLAFLTLEVRESNAPARALYEKAGFRTAGVRKNYYERPREDAVLMTAAFPKEDEGIC